MCIQHSVLSDCFEHIVGPKNLVRDLIWWFDRLTAAPNLMTPIFYLDVIARVC